MLLRHNLPPPRLTLSLISFSPNPLTSSHCRMPSLFRAITHAFSISLVPMSSSSDSRMPGSTEWWCSTLQSIALAYSPPSVADHYLSPGMPVYVPPGAINPVSHLLNSCPRTLHLECRPRPHPIPSMPLPFCAVPIGHRKPLDLFSFGSVAARGQLGLSSSGSGIVRRSILTWSWKHPALSSSRSQLTYQLLDLGLFGWFDFFLILGLIDVWLMANHHVVLDDPDLMTFSLLRTWTIDQVSRPPAEWSSLFSKLWHPVFDENSSWIRLKF